MRYTTEELKRLVEESTHKDKHKKAKEILDANSALLAKEVLALREREKMLVGAIDDLICTMIALPVQTKPMEISVANARAALMTEKKEG